MIQHFTFNYLQVLVTFNLCNLLKVALFEAIFKENIMFAFLSKYFSCHYDQVDSNNESHNVPDKADFKFVLISPCVQIRGYWLLKVSGF